jgi:hypothetical protein
MKLQDLKSKYDSLRIKKNLTGKEALDAVKQDGHALRYVQTQTEEICLAAVKQNVYALQYVQTQTEEICLAAVKQDGHALRYVQENMFKQEPIELTLEEIASRFNIDVNLLKIIK